METGTSYGHEGEVDISSERMMGLIGSVLAFAGVIPRVGGILSLIGLILVLIALNGIGTSSTMRGRSTITSKQ